MNKTNQQIVNQAARASIITNILMTVFKLFAGVLGNSAAMISDAVHSLADLFSTAIAVVGIKLAARKADKDHPYGHERFECVASVFLAILIFVVGAGIGWVGLQNIISGDNYTMPGAIALVAAVVSLVGKEGLFRYLRRAARKIDSSAMMADAWHSRADALSSIGSFVGIGGAMLGFPIMDSIAAIVICGFILKTAISIFLDAIGKMTDRACDDETVEKMRQVILSQDAVEGIDSLMTRIFGNKIYVDVDILVNPLMTLKAAHDVSHAVHDAIETQFPKVKHCMVHVSPGEEILPTSVQ
ncbi:MAG: cation diffusion facilitator family transporter [Defluviitaleaceae bacterium]|nr:cation diffusion facilitator family transporter [Defluviitaleaceae bacterium]